MGWAVYLYLNIAAWHRRHQLLYLTSVFLPARLPYPWKRRHHRVCKAGGIKNLATGFPCRRCAEDPVIPPSDCKCKLQGSVIVRSAWPWTNSCLLRVFQVPACCVGLLEPILGFGSQERDPWCGICLEQSPTWCFLFRDDILSHKVHFKLFLFF